MILRTFLLWTTGIVLFSVVVFVLPLVATGIVLAFTMLLSPAVWIVGSSYAANGRQAFFRGGLITGILPLVVASGVALTLGLSGFFAPIYRPQPRNVGVGRPPGTLAAPASSTVPDNESTPVLNSSEPYPPPSDVPPAVTGTLPASDLPDSLPPTYVRSESLPTAPLPLAYSETLSMRIAMASIWLAPGVIAFLGGGLSYLTFRLVRPKETDSAALASSAPSVPFTMRSRDVSGSGFLEQKTERVASERG